MFILTEDYRKGCVALLDIAIEKINKEIGSLEEFIATNTLKSIGIDELTNIAKSIFGSPPFHLDAPKVEKFVSMATRYLEDIGYNGFPITFKSVSPVSDMSAEQVIHLYGSISMEYDNVILEHTNKRLELNTSLEAPCLLRGKLLLGSIESKCILNEEERRRIVLLEKENVVSQDEHRDRELIVHVGDSKLIVPENQIKVNRKEGGDYISFELEPFIRKARSEKRGLTHSVCALSMLMADLSMLTVRLREGGGSGPLLGIAFIDDAKDFLDPDYITPTLCAAYDPSNIYPLKRFVRVVGFRLPPPIKK